MLWQRFDVAKIVELRDGCVFKTKLVGSYWKAATDTRSEREIATDFGGDMLVPTDDWTIAKEPPER